VTVAAIDGDDGESISSASRQIEDNKIGGRSVEGLGSSWSRDCHNIIEAQVAGVRPVQTERRNMSSPVRSEARVIQQGRRTRQWSAHCS